MTSKCKFQRFSDLGRHLSDVDRSSIAKRKAIPAVIKTPVSHDFRKMLRVEVQGDTFWADRTTGTLYCPRTGECQSSTSLELVLDSLGRAFDDMKKHFPGLTKRWAADLEFIQRNKPGPKAGGFNRTGEL